MPLSDRYGRAFEYCVAKAVFSKLEQSHPQKVRMALRAKESQRHGEAQFADLSEREKKQFRRSAVKIAEWLAENKLKKPSEMKFEKPAFSLADYVREVSGKKLRTSTSRKIERVELDRIPDTAGRKGDVTDIRIKFVAKCGVANVNISLKHRHEALKHPRLTNVPDWIGIANTKEARQYLTDYENIWSTFFEKGEKLSPDAKRFRELKAIDANFVEENLYKPLYSLVKNFLQQNIKEPSQVQQMFDFMIGKFDYIKFVDHDGDIEVLDFSNIPAPNSVKIGYTSKGYLRLVFDNGWKISGRLHTATQWLKKSIKFDVQPMNLDEVVPALHMSTFQETLG